MWLCPKYGRKAAKAARSWQKKSSACARLRAISTTATRPISTIEEKLDAIVKKIYHGDGVVLTDAAKKQAKRLTELGFANYPICMAKTQYSFSDNAKLLGAPKNFTVTVRNLKVSAAQASS